METESSPESQLSQTVKTSLTAEESSWLADEFWPVPKWFQETTEAGKHRDYQAYLTYNLRTRYYELEGDFRTAYNNFATSLQMDFGTAKRVASNLQLARKALEGESVEVLTVANLLDLVDRYMIWLYPSYSARQKAMIRAKHLEADYPNYAEVLTIAAQQADEAVDPKLLALKASYDEVVGEINKHNIEDQISFGLQIQRLEVLRSGGIIGLILSLITLSFLLNMGGLDPEQSLVQTPFFAWITALSPFLTNLLVLFVLGSMGALGGFMSGLLQVRNNKVNLIEFKESLLTFQLKPIVGALTAILISVLLSWNVLPGIEFVSLGSFIMTAFLTGFSERYFLKLIKIDEVGAENGE